MSSMQSHKGVRLFLSVFLRAVVLIVLQSCAPRPIVPVVEHAVLSERMVDESIGGTHIRIVQPGDTLHAIAFENNLSVDRLAAWNGLQDRRRINIGQRLRLTRPINFREIEKNVAKPENRIVSKGGDSNKNDKGSGKPKPTSAFKPTVVAGSSQVKKVNWLWPLNGKLLTSFAPKNGKQGVDIQGALGQAVLAASSGDVVYVGNSLKGYGNLIIIKHSELYLSAYAHNAKIFVKEGQKVASHHRIGAVGRNNAGQAALHFQIRKDGKPVNPLAYLPAK